MPVFKQNPKIREVTKITDTDEGKVLTAKDGEAVWEEATGTEVLVLDDIDDLPAGTKDGTIVVVPSAESEESGGSESGTSGLTVVELETPFEENALLSESDCAKLTAVIGSPIIVKYTTEEGILLQIFAAYGTIEGMHVFLLYGNSGVMSEDGNTWGYIPNL